MSTEAAPSYLGDSLPIAISLRASDIPVEVLATSATKCFFKAPDTPETRSIVEAYVRGTLSVNIGKVQQARITLAGEIRGALSRWKQQDGAAK